MRLTGRSARLGRQAIAGAALAALLAWAPFGAATQAPAYADESGAQAAAGENLAAEGNTTGDGTAFDAALPEGEAHSASGDDAFFAGEDTATAGGNGPLADGDDALIADAAVCPDADDGIAAQASGSPTYDGTLAVRADKSYSLAWQVLTLVNQERAKQGLSALTMDADLLDAAMQRAAETAVCFDHTRPSGESCFTACSKMTRENIASGDSTAQAVMKLWMNSSGHRANILSSGTKSIGIGCVKVSGQYFWVQCFSTAKATAVSKPADVSNTLMKVDVTADGLKAFGSSFEIHPVTSDGASIINATAELRTGTPQRYALFTYPWGDGKGSLTRIDDSCIKWSLSGTGAKLDASTATMTVTGAGTFTLTASAGGGAVKQTLTKTAYTVSFNTNGGSSVASQAVAGGSTPNKPADPTKSGYSFLGWYSDSALTKPCYFTDVVKSNVTIYAKWEAQAASPFKDVPAGKWYTDWVAQAAKAGLMTGHKGADGTYTGYFEPNGTITRAQVATVLWRIAGSPSASAGAFSDMSGHWAATAVAWCSAKGIVTGYTGGPDAGKFVPDRQVSRQELAVMVWRFAKWSGVKTANPPTAAFNSCGDAWSVPDWSRQAMTWCAAAGVITGVQGGAKPMLCPQDGATRAMAAKIFVQTQKIASGATSPYAEDGAAGEAQAGPDEVTFDDVQDVGAAVVDEAFDAVEPGEAGATGEATGGSGSKPEQAGEAADDSGSKPEQADLADETTDAAEYPGNDDSADAGAANAADAPAADATDIAGPDAAGTFAEPATAGEPDVTTAPAANAADVPDLAEFASFDSLDVIAA